MTFDELWKQVKGLPSEALEQVPDILSSNTKRLLARMTPEDIGRIVGEAIDEINHGSIETFDTLVRKRL